MRKSLLIASGLLISTAVNAKPLTVKDWSLDDTSNICVASTTRNLENQAYRLELNFDKSGLYPVEVAIRELPSTSSTRAFRFVTEMKPILNFAFAPIQDSTGGLSFWQVPSDTDSLVSYMKRQTRLLVQAVTPQGAGAATTKAVDFSLRGSSAAIDALIAQCNGGKSIVQTDFEKSFVAGSAVAQLDGLRLSETQTADLRNLYRAAIDANAQKLALQKQLTALNTKYAAQIQELARVSGSLDQLTQKELLNAQNLKASIEARIVALDAIIANQQPAIDAKEAQVVSANATYEQAWQVLAPSEPEHKRLNDAIQTSRDDLQRSQSRLNEIDSSLQSKSNAITNYQNQLNSLRSQLTQVDMELSRANYDVNYAEAANQRFDARRERDERLFDHPAYRYCRQENRGACDYLANTIENDASREVENVRSRLSSNASAARNLVNQKTSELSALQSQIRDYSDYQIPALQNQIADLRSQRSSAESAVSRARDQVGARTSALQSYDISVNYAAKRSAYEAAAAVVVGLQRELAQLEQVKVSSTRERAQKVIDLAATDKKIQDVLTKIQQTQTRSSELNQALVPYFSEKASIEAGIGQAVALIAANKQAFAGIIAL